MTEKVALREIGPRFTLKLRSVRTGLPAVKGFGECSTKLEFDEFDVMATDGGQPEGKSQPPPEEVNEGGKGEAGVDDGKSGSKSRNKTKPPTVDEYQRQWNVSDPGLHLVAPY